MIEKMIEYLDVKLEKSKDRFVRLVELDRDYPEWSSSQIRKIMNKVDGMRTALFPLINESNEAKRLHDEMAEFINEACAWLNDECEYEQNMEVF